MPAVRAVPMNDIVFCFSDLGLNRTSDSGWVCEHDESSCAKRDSFVRQNRTPMVSVLDKITARDFNKRPADFLCRKLIDALLAPRYIEYKIRRSFAPAFSHPYLDPLPEMT